MKRVAMGVGLLALTFGIGLALFFPTDAVVRALLDRVPLANNERLTFDAARLGVRGLRLERVTLLDADGEPRLAADWVQFRPSLWGLVRGRLGSPWRLGLGIFGGSIDATLDHDGERGALDVTWDHLEMGTLVPLFVRRTEIAGHLSGTASMTLVGRTPSTGKGTIDARAARWVPSYAFLDDAPLRADTATIGWTLGNQRLDFEQVAVTGPDFHVQGKGNVKIQRSFTESLLDLRFDVTPQKGLHSRLRQVFDGVTNATPGSLGMRTILVSGTIDNPRARTP